MSIRTVVADDEVLARQKLLQLLRAEPEIEVVGEGATAAETIDLVRIANPDLLFLDIQMPGMDGFDIIQALSSGRNVDLPRIVFTTAYDHYALKAFEIHAADYLLKPFTRERLHNAIEHAKAQIERAKHVNEPKTTKAHDYTERVVFKSRGRILFLPIAEIHWISAEENYVRICTAKESHLLRDTMTHFESRLDPRLFLRIHRSTIVNLQHVKEIRSDSVEGESFVVLSHGQKLPVSRGYRSRITGLLVS
jgi:two-component system, LytTR family, response regulator